MTVKISAIASTLLLAVTMQANAATEIYEDHNGYEAPSGSRMLMDAVIAKPIQVAMVAGGAVTWAISLPFTLPTNSHQEAWGTLVEGPAENLQRCLGCTDLQDQNRLIQEYQKERAAEGTVLIPELVEFK